MTRKDWLLKKWKELDDQVEEMEAERSTIRSPEHKATLVDLKKQRLIYKTELLELVE